MYTTLYIDLWSDEALTEFSYNYLNTIINFLTSSST